MNPSQLAWLIGGAILAAVLIVALLCLWSSTPAGKKKFDAELTAAVGWATSGLPQIVQLVIGAEIAKLEAQLDTMTGQQKFDALVAACKAKGIMIPPADLQAAYDLLKLAGEVGQPNTNPTAIAPPIQAAPGGN
jgi:hypothetical protein